MIKNKESQINPTINLVNPKYSHYDLVKVTDEKIIISI